MPPLIFGAPRKKSAAETAPYHLFVVNGVLNDALYNKREDIDIQIYDISKKMTKRGTRKLPTMFMKLGSLEIVLF